MYVSRERFEERRQIAGPALKGEGPAEGVRIPRQVYIVFNNKVRKVVYARSGFKVSMEINHLSAQEV